MPEGRAARFEPPQGFSVMHHSCHLQGTQEAANLTAEFTHVKTEAQARSQKYGDPEDCWVLDIRGVGVCVKDKAEEFGDLFID